MEDGEEKMRKISMEAIVEEGETEGHMRTKKKKGQDTWIIFLLMKIDN